MHTAVTFETFENNYSYSTEEANLLDGTSSIQPSIGQIRQSGSRECYEYAG